MTLRHDAMALQWYAQETHQDPLQCLRCSPLVTPTRAQVRAIRRARGDAKIPLQAEPRALEKRYQRKLRARMKEVDKLLMSALKAPLAKLAAEVEKQKQKEIDAKKDGRSRRQDTVASELRNVLQVITRIKVAVDGSPFDVAAIEALGESIDRFTSGAIDRQLQTVAGIDVTIAAAEATAELALLSDWVTVNVNLAESLSARYFDEITNLVQSSVVEGTSTRTLSKQLQERFDVSQSRANLIARDQVGTLNAEITKQRQTSLGIEEYIWTTVGDDRVRPEHVALDGTTQRWDTPVPGEGFPGSPIACRCAPTPILNRNDAAMLRMLIRSMRWQARKGRRYAA